MNTATSQAISKTATVSRDEFIYADLGDRYAVMRKKRNEGWKALFFVPLEAEAIDLVDLCIEPSKRGFEFVQTLAIGGPLKTHWSKCAERG
jgi:hypothetical protein